MDSFRPLVEKLDVIFAAARKIEVGVYHHRWLAPHVNILAKAFRSCTVA
jgi:hypothetical protein